MTLETTDTAVSIKGVTLSEDGKTVTVSLDGNLTDETAYTVKIPVKPSEKAFTETNQSSVAVQSYYSNTTAGMSYEYDANHTGTVTYKEKPTILVARQVTLTYDDNVTDEEIAVPEAASAAVETDESKDNYNEAEFTIGRDPSREGYTFLGWNTDKGAAEADSAYAAGSKVNLGANTTLYAVWKQNTTTYTLKYDANAGEDTVTVPADDTYTGTEDSHDFTVSNEEPARTGYTFLGWANATDSTEADVKETVTVSKTDADQTKTIYAVWAKEYEVSYNVMGDKPEDYTAPSAVKKLKGDEVTVEAAPESPVTGQKDGINGTYTFTGWTAPNGVKIEGGKFTMPDQDVELTGVWTFTPDTYTVTWMNGETQLEEDKNVAHNATPSFDGTEPVKAADDDNTYTFKGWAKYADSTETVNLADEKVTKDVTYYAVFESQAIDKYEVTYKVNGDVPEGYNAPEKRTGLKAGDEVTVAAVGTTEEMTRDGVKGTWTFTGWTAPEGVEVGEGGKFTMPASNAEFTGSWTFTPAKHTVKFVNDDGSEISSM